MKTARNLMPKKLTKRTGFSDGPREHHSSFRHPGVDMHSEHDAEWRHGKGDDEHMSNPGMAFTNENPDAQAIHAGHKFGTSHGLHPRLAHIKARLMHHKGYE